MNKIKKCISRFALLALLVTIPVSAIEVAVVAPCGEKVVIDVNPDETIGNVMAELNRHFVREGDQGLFLFGSCDLNDEEGLVCKAAEIRDYYAKVPESVVKDIQFIILTLGNEPLVKLKKYKSRLKTAGDHLENIHPLNVWRVIFSDSDTISAMHNVRRRRDVWKSFIKGMAKSFQEASDKNNMDSEYIEDFARKLNINLADITPFLEQQDWAGFIKQLLIIVPRDGEPGRYDQ